MNKTELGKAILDAAYLEGDFILRSGKRSKYYLDKYLFETKPEILSAIAEEMSEIMPEGVDRIAGTELGAVALAAALSLRTKLPFVIARKATKDYGTSKAIEGEFRPGEKVVLVEDIMTTGGAALNAADVLKEAGLDVVLVIGTIDREQGAREAFDAKGLKYVVLFTKTELGI